MKSPSSCCQKGTRAPLRVTLKFPTGSHLGKDKTQEHLLDRFFWPGILQELKQFGQSFPECQLAHLGCPLRALLAAMPLMEEAFE